MQSEKHQGKGLQYLTVLPDEYDDARRYPLVIMLHGFGANMQDLAGLAPVINSKGYIYACPNAPIAFDLGLGQAGYGWASPGGEATAEQYSTAENLLGDFFEEITRSFFVAPGNALLLGFSQGGGMTFRCGLARPETFAGLVALSSMLPNSDTLEERLPKDRTQHIFIAHGLSDPLIPAETAQDAKAFLEGAGYSPEYHEYAMAHEISEEVLRDLVPWMTQVLPPLDNVS